MNDSISVPGMADTIRKRCLNMMEHKAYYMLASHLIPVIKEMTDDEVNELGPTDILQELADIYPRGNSD